MSKCPTGATGPHDASRSAPRHGGNRVEPGRLLRQTTPGGGGAGGSLAPGPFQRDPLPPTSTLREAPLLPIQAVGEVVGQLEPDRLVDLDLALRGWLELP